MSEVKLPEGWIDAQLGAVIELKYGKSLPAQSRDGEGYPVYGSNGVVGKHSAPLIKTCGLIIGRKGSYGEVQFSKDAFSPIDTTYFVDELYEQPIKYWFYQLKYLPLTELNRSTAIPGLNREDAYEQKIKLPSLTEQEIIAEKLDTLLALVDSAKARLEQIPQILKRFRQSVLTAAVSGKLTEEWREERLLTIDDWLITCVGNIAQVATGKTPKRTEPKYWDNGSISWLTSSSTGNSITTSAEQFVTELALKECTLKLFGPGTLLLAMYGEGKTRGQVTELKLNAACNQACAAIIVIEEKVHRSFMKIRLMENYEQTRKTAVGGNQPNLNLNKVREISIKLPSLEEQAQIVNRVEKLFAYADTIEKQVQAALLRVNNLTQSILAKAFRGELTAQWRAENPDLINGENSAEALLVRIKQERLKNKPVKRGKGNS